MYALKLNPSNANKRHIQAWNNFLGMKIHVENYSWCSIDEALRAYKGNKRNFAKSYIIEFGTEADATAFVLRWS